jgi:N-acetylmuramoyl-L-alanine amidase
MSATLSSSLDAGSHILGKMGSFAHLHKKTVEQAGFLVLKSPDVPSILVETGFISNPGEAKKLATSQYRQKMANSIYTGIREFFEKNPPGGTYLAWQQSGGKEAPFVAANSGNQQIYIVASGDTLSGISNRFNVSIGELKKINKLSGNAIRVGQKLAINKAVLRQLAQLDAAANETSRPLHKVSLGDTLSGIALRYESSVAAIRQQNKLNGTAIKIGQQLVIP